ncbi:hypothetical protein HJFPF1_04512 [Paramyrothecium foliicola]|nr:hypothetical protein HJFPF1_04512 [Paramyrothecium foliicola]
MSASFIAEALGKRQSGSKEANSTCSDKCDAAYKEAQSVGKTEDLCKDGSDFRQVYAGCAACIQDNGGSDDGVTEVMPELAPFLAQCSLDVVTSTMTMVMTDGQVSTLVFVVAPTAPVDEDQRGPPWGTGTPPWGTGPPPWATGRAGQFKCPGEDGDDVSIPVEYRSYLPPWCEARWDDDGTASATSVKAPATTTPDSSNSVEQTPSRRTTFSTATITNSLIQTPLPTNSDASSVPGSGNSADRAWIAGPAVGSLAGLALIFGFVFFLWRRRRRSGMTNPTELDSDEVASKTRPDTLYEMEGSTPIELYAEKPANEAPAKELRNDGNAIHGLIGGRWEYWMVRKVLSTALLAARNATKAVVNIYTPLACDVKT